MYEQFRNDPDSVGETWREFFDDYRPMVAPTAEAAPAAAPAPAPAQPLATSAPAAAAGTPAAGTPAADGDRKSVV